MPFSTLQFLSADTQQTSITYSLLSAETTFPRAAAQGYYVNIAAATTVTLPASPLNGDSIILETISAMATNNLTVARNGNTIGALAENLVIDTTGTRAELVYFNGDWKVYLT